MEYRIADIVRIKGEKGLFEITGDFTGKTYHYAVTNNECDTELYVNKDELIFVCSAYSRQDINV